MSHPFDIRNDIYRKLKYDSLAFFYQQRSSIPIEMPYAGVPELDRVTYGESAQAETVRKMVVAMARDIRVLVIKLADRLHNMRTIAYLQARQAGAEGPRDARDLRAAGAPPRHEHDQVGARGPRVRDAVPQAVRRDRAAGRERAPARDKYLRRSSSRLARI